MYKIRCCHNPGILQNILLSQYSRNVQNNLLSQSRNCTKYFAVTIREMLNIFCCHVTILEISKHIYRHDRNNVQNMTPVS